VDTEVFGFLTSQARLAIWRDDEASLLHYIERIRRLGTPQAEYLGRALERLEEGGRMLEQLGQTLPSPRTRIFFSQISAEFSGWRGHHEVAMTSVERAVRAGLYDVCWMERCPPLAPVRGQPRFQELLAEVQERAAPLVAALRG
jgi:hypothetical protein